MLPVHCRPDCLMYVYILTDIKSVYSRSTFPLLKCPLQPNKFTYLVKQIQLYIEVLRYFIGKSYMIGFCNGNVLE